MMSEAVIAAMSTLLRVIFVIIAYGARTSDITTVYPVKTNVAFAATVETSTLSTTIVQTNIHMKHPHIVEDRYFQGFI
jgi:hypothetical protein